MYLARTLESVLKKRLFKGKVLIVYGPRQVGKTTLLKRVLQELPEHPAVLFNGDLSDDRMLLSDASPDRLRSLLGRKRVMLVDEAQNVPDIGKVLKRIADFLPDVQVLVSGSSSFDLVNKTSEPLTGRKFEYTLPPFSFGELSLSTDLKTERDRLESRLILGSYPEIVTHPDDATERLRALTGSYLYKDVFALQAVRSPETLDKLLRALSLQCGSEVSCREVGQLIGADGKTVERYIDVLVKSFVLFVLPAFSRNARNELKKSKKVYFHDCGIRNAVIGNFLPLTQRTDAGILWENYLMSERYKWRLLQAPDSRAYFWRNQDQSEVDLVEETADQLSAFEFKWGNDGSVRIPKAFTTAYPDARLTVITRKNYDGFLTGSV